MKKKFKDLDLSNAFLFAAALQEPDICQMVLEIIFGTKLPKVKVNTEHTVLFSSDFRSVRFDVYASSETEVNYNVEGQNNSKRNLPKRSRFHQAEMDVMALKPGDDFSLLKPSYVVFICTFDPFGKGRYQYTFEERCLEADFPLGDETRKIFLNSKGKNPQETPELLVHFLKYMENSTEECATEVNEEKIRLLHEKIVALKESRDLEAKYMTLGEWLDEEAAKEKEVGRAEGRAEGLVQGKTEALSEALLNILKMKGAVSAELQGKIESVRDNDILMSWIELAVNAVTIEEFTKQI